MATPPDSELDSSDRVAVAKYKCTSCGFKWKLKNTHGDERACKMCHKSVSPYKKKPKVLRRMFGQFYCSQCSRRWFSGNAWEGKGQECVKCGRMCLPESLRPLRYRRHDPDDVKKPHIQECCEMCKELGKNCQEVREVKNEEVADDESVYSEYSMTSDSSAASVQDPRDFDSDTTPVASDDETEDMVEQLEKMKL